MHPAEALARLTVVDFVVLALCAHRVTRLLIEDSILDSPRNWVFTRAGDTVAELLSCPWCFGFWASLALFAVYLSYPATAVLLALPWALSDAVGLLAPRELPPESRPDV